MSESSDLGLLTRFEGVPSGRGRPGALGRALLAAFERRGCSVQAWDPLDSAIRVPGRRPWPVSTVLVALVPLRPHFDLPFLRALAQQGVRAENPLPVLARFQDPMTPLMVLDEAGFPVYPALYLRKPLVVDAAPPRLPGKLEVFLPDGTAERMEVRDAGSLDGILNLTWRKDRTALFRPGLEETRIVPVVAGRAFTDDGAAGRLALQVASALDLGLGRVEMAGPADRLRVVSVCPCPAARVDELTDEVAGAMVDYVLGEA